MSPSPNVIQQRECGVNLTEGCPPPLRCRDVWNAVQQQAECWALPRVGYKLSGWTLGEGHPLYFVTGFAGSAALYALLAWLLRDHYRCVIYEVDLNDRGGPVTLADFTTDLLDAATLLGDEVFSVYGATFGGMVAVQAAAVAGERIERLILQSVPTRVTLSPAERLLAHCYRHSRRSLARLPFRLTVQKWNHQRWFPPLDPERWAFFLEQTGRHPIAWPARQALALDGVDLRPLLPNLTQPVLLIDTEGTGHRLAHAQQELLSQLSQVHVERLHTTGLHPYLTHPHRVAKLIRSWWNKPHWEASPPQTPLAGRSRSRNTGAA